MKLLKRGRSALNDDEVFKQTNNILKRMTESNTKKKATPKKR